MSRKYPDLQKVSRELADKMTQHIIGTKACNTCTNIVNKAMMKVYLKGLQDGLDEST